jgi:hypothetical protein
MSDVTVKRVEDFDSPNEGGFCRARAGLGVTAFGMQVEQFPPNFEHFPEHDHAEDGQEEVYTLLSGSATGAEPARLLAIGGTPGAAYAAPPFTEEGASLPG